MAKEIFMGAFVLLHCLFCLLKVFCHFDILHCIHLIPYFIFIDFLKNNLHYISKLAKQDPTDLDIDHEKTILKNDVKIIDDKIIIDFNNGDNSSQRFSMDNLYDADNSLERCLSNKTSSSLTLTGDVSDANETDASFIQAGESFFNETPHIVDEKMLEMNNDDLKSQDLEHFKNENHFLDDSTFLNSVAIHLIDAAVQCTPAERNGSLASSTPSSSFTNVTEMESFNDSEDPKDFDDFSMNSFKSNQEMDSISSDLTSLSDSAEDTQCNDISSVPRKRNAFQKVKKFFGRLRKAIPSCCRCQRLH
ncbi:hypothetical protein TNCT_138271 [Trichonephila clavata]|uniref:Uncharacterized protein n=1 Tax=Trichonephila clavata TaxID=2740835 RepID=A0A8X6LXJ8_TRICU|nr:hypothetical protein TNCT_138271 [Trichonephila clavata]